MTLVNTFENGAKVLFRDTELAEFARLLSIIRHNVHKNIVPIGEGLRLLIKSEIAA